MTATAGNPSGHPIFEKYTRKWLHEHTGYSKGYLSRISLGKIPLSRAFVERVCYKLGLPESELFVEGGEDDHSSL